MAKVKSIVAGMVKSGKSFKCIIGQAKKDGVTKWKMVKVILWTMYLKTVDEILYWLKIFAAVICFIVCVIINLVVALISPLWYPVMVKFAPKKAANFITEERELNDKVKGFKGIVIFFWNLSENFIFYNGMGFCWGWIWKYLPMAKRQYYLDATCVKLDTLSVDEQLAYYRRNPSTETVRKMSFEAVDELRLQYKSLEDLKNICDVYEIYEELGKELFSGADTMEAMYELLKSYCANEKKRITEKFTGFLIETVLKGEGGKAWSRASSLLLLCCENHTLPNHQLIMLAAGQGYKRPIGNEAKVMLERYFSRHSFTDDVIRQIINFATDGTIDECKEKNFELLCKIVRRDGLSTELAERFFSSCDKVQNEKMSDILKVRMDCEKVGYSYDNDENRENWKQYCYLCKDISSDAQLQMKEWQYDIYRACGHKLDKDVLYELLVKRISREDMSYFKKVLDEEIDRVTLSDMGNTLIMMCPWKREIILPLLVAEKEKDNSITL